jgi:hypothetical protein
MWHGAMLEFVQSAFENCCDAPWSSEGILNIRSAKQDDNYGASNIVLPCPGSWVIFHLVEDVVIILKSSI